MGIVSEFDKAFALKRQEVKRHFEKIGAEAVEHAKRSGNYRNRTGNLRRSNRYHATESTLTIENTADYASDVEARGYNVLSATKLKLMGELR